MPQYLAPEQLSNRRRPTEAATDLYALGVLLYELMTGRTPVKGTSRDEVLRQTTDFPPPSPRQYQPEIPAELEAIVKACLAKDPRSRPASARQLAESLRALAPPMQVDAQPAWWKNWLGWM
jgi:serine/threonine-protein kinase